jgi:signal transduction histidine kinase
MGGTPPMPPAAVPGRASTLRIVLLAAASTLVLGMILFSQRVTERLLEKERQIVDLYARSYEYLSADNSAGGDYSFLFEEIIRTIDFPIVVTDAAHNPQYYRNIDLDTAGTGEAERTARLRAIVASMDERNPPIRIALNDTLVLNYIHYGESDLIVQLRWLPWIEIALAGLFLLVAYIGFSTIKRSEQSSIWVGMAKETAHQLGTPLSSLMGWLELAREEARTSPQLASTVHEMEQDIERLNKVAGRFSKIGSRPDLREENLTEVIEGVMRYIGRRIPTSGRSVDLRIEQRTEVRAPINRELFEWVIENLMKNALDAMEGPTGSIVFTLSREGRSVVVDVTDSGRGIDPKHHKDVFRPGYSTKKRGWGLGLSLSKRIIEEYHRGKLTVRTSSPGAGTTFRIRLAG